MKNIFALNRALAKIGRLSPEAQRAILGMPDLHEMLAHNKFTSLDTQVWFDIYGKKKLTDAYTATGLVSRPLDQEQVSFVLKKEKRSSVIAAMMQRNTLSLDQIQVVLKNKYINRVAAEVLSSQNFTQDSSFERSLRLEVSRMAGAAAWADFLAWDPDTSLEEAEELFASLQGERWLPRGSKWHFGRLLKRFPSLVKKCVAPAGSAALLQLACGSTVLCETADQIQAIKSAGTRDDSHFPLLALANSPFTSKEALEEIARLGNFGPDAYTVIRSLDRRAQKARPTLERDIASEDNPETLVWLVSRALPFRGRDGSYTPAKVFELEELARNRNLTEEQSRSVVAALVSEPDVMDAFSAEEIASSLQIQYSRFSGLPIRDPADETANERFYSIRSEVRACMSTSGIDAERQSPTSDNPGNIFAGSIDDYWRGESLLFLESQAVLH